MSTVTVTPLRQRMIEDMNARKLGAHSQRSHTYSSKRFAAFLKRAPDTATPDDVRRFQLHLAETGMSICNRNRIMTRTGSATVYGNYDAWYDSPGSCLELRGKRYGARSETRSKSSPEP